MKKLLNILLIWSIVVITLYQPSYINAKDNNVVIGKFVIAGLEYSLDKPTWLQDYLDANPGCTSDQHYDQCTDGITITKEQALEIRELWTDDLAPIFFSAEQISEVFDDFRGLEEFKNLKNIGDVTPPSRGIFSAPFTKEQLMHTYPKAVAYFASKDVASIWPSFDVTSVVDVDGDQTNSFCVECDVIARSPFLELITQKYNEVKQAFEKDNTISKELIKKLVQKADDIYNKAKNTINRKKTYYLKELDIEIPPMLNELDELLIKGNREIAKEKIQRLNYISNSEKEEYIKKIDSVNNEEIDPIINEAESVNTNKKDAIDKIEIFELQINDRINKNAKSLSEEEKREYIRQIDEVVNASKEKVINGQSDTTSIEANRDAGYRDITIVYNNAVLTSNKNEAKESIEGMNSLTETEKKEYKQRINDANSRSAISSIVDKANELNSAREEAKNKVRDLEALSDIEKKQYIDRINVANKDDINGIVSEANETNNKKQQIIDELTAYANEAKTKLDELTTLNDKNNHVNKIDEVLNQKIDEIKKQPLNNSETLKNQGISEIDDLLNIAINEDLTNKANKFKNDHQTVLNKDLNDINEADKEAILNTLTELNKLDPSVKGKLTKEENILNSMIQKLDNDLNTARDEAKNKIKALDSLSNEEKNKYINLITTANKNDIDGIVSEAQRVNQAKDEAIQEVETLGQQVKERITNNLNSLTADQKQQYIKEIDELISNKKTEIINGGEGDVTNIKDAGLKEISDKYKDALKNDAKNIIEALANLTTDQKQALNTEIDTTDDINAVVDKARELDNKTMELKAEVEKGTTIVASNNYVKASSDKKNEYDAALNEAQALLNGGNIDGETIIKAKERLVAASLGLDGIRSEVAKFKQDHQAILAKKVAQLQGSDSELLNKALADYNRLSKEAKQELVKEKGHLDILAKAMDKILDEVLAWYHEIYLNNPNPNNNINTKLPNTGTK